VVGLRLERNVFSTWHLYKKAGFIDCIRSDAWRRDGPCWSGSWGCWSWVHTSYYRDTDSHRL